MPAPSARSGSIAVAALAVELSSGGAGLRVLPFGEFRARDGRPTEVASWKLTKSAAQKIVTALAARRDDLVIDYEHQTLYADKSGHQAPAAGWMKPRAELRADGLYMTDVEFTERAKAAIAAKEYRYFSPVFAYDKRTGEVIDLLMGALTNHAGLDGLTDLTARAAARFALNTNDDGGNTMNKDQLALLGLSEDATPEQITAALTALKTKADGAESASTELAALKAQKPDPAKFVPVEVVTQLQTQVAALTAANTEREVADLVDTAMSEGKILPAMEPWARELGKKDIAQLKAYIDAAQPIAALKGTQTGGKAPEGGNAGGPATEAACKAEYEASAALRDEFDTLGAYIGWRKIEAASAR